MERKVNYRSHLWSLCNIVHQLSFQVYRELLINYWALTPLVQAARRYKLFVFFSFLSTEHDFIFYSTQPSYSLFHCLVILTLRRVHKTAQSWSKFPEGSLMECYRSNRAELCPTQGKKKKLELLHHRHLTNGNWIQGKCLNLLICKMVRVTFINTFTTLSKMPNVVSTNILLLLSLHYYSLPSLS